MTFQLPICFFEYEVRPYFFFLILGIFFAFLHSVIPMFLVEVSPDSLWFNSLPLGLKGHPHLYLYLLPGFAIFNTTEFNKMGHATSYSCPALLCVRQSSSQVCGCWQLRNPKEDFENKLVHTCHPITHRVVSSEFVQDYRRFRNTIPCKLFY